MSIIATVLCVPLVSGALGASCGGGRLRSDLMHELMVATSEVPPHTSLSCCLPKPRRSNYLVRAVGCRLSVGFGFGRLKNNRKANKREGQFPSQGQVQVSLSVFLMNLSSRPLRPGHHLSRRPGALVVRNFLGLGRGSVAKKEAHKAVAAAEAVVPPGIDLLDIVAKEQIRSGGLTGLGFSDWPV